MVELRDLAPMGSDTIGVRPQWGFHAFRAFRGSDSALTLRGEIVDSKCFLGVMNPAEGAVHRDCARRCLSGGMPPMLLMRDGEHREELVVLVSDDGRGIGREIAQAAGTPVDVTGRLVRDGRDFVLYVSAWRRQG
jgi:hypothetical protein